MWRVRYLRLYWTFVQQLTLERRVLFVSLFLHGACSKIQLNIPSTLLLLKAIYTLVYDLLHTSKHSFDYSGFEDLHLVKCMQNKTFKYFGLKSDTKFISVLHCQSKVYSNCTEHSTIAKYVFQRHATHSTQQPRRLILKSDFSHARNFQTETMVFWTLARHCSNFK